MSGCSRLCSAVLLCLLVLGCSAASGTDASRSRARLERGLAVHADLLEQRHLAELGRNGWLIDFGTPAQDKYTVGDWRSGWGAHGVDGDETFAFVGMRGRIYFDADARQTLTAMIRLKPYGTQALTPYLNGGELKSVHLADKNGFANYTVTLPQDRLHAGENQLMLTFGGTTPVNGEPVSVAVSSVHLAETAGVSDVLTLPSYEGSRAAVRIDGTTRQALVQRTPGTLRYHLQVPASAQLVFGVGVEGDQPAHAQLVVEPEGGAREVIFSAQVGSRWEERAVDLAAFAGRVVRLDFEAAGSGARVAWSQPRLMVPERQAPKPGAKNLIVLLVDTLRADKLKAFNPNSRVRTPAVDAIAAQGVVFERAQSPENWTKPAVASVLTGLHPQTHRQKTGDAALPDSALLLSEQLQQAGLKTASFIANGYVSDRFGFDQGWDQYTNYIRENKNTEAEQVFKDAAAWIAEHKDERFFAYIQTIDPHVPYDPPGEFLAQYDDKPYAGPVKPRMTGPLLEQAKTKKLTFSARDRERLEALHDAEIAQHDHFLAGFVQRLQELGLWEDTLLVITADHGEEFNDHGSWGHGHSVYDELLHVPLIFTWRGKLAAGARVQQAVSTMDIGPTALELLGVDPFPHADGHSLSPFLSGGTPARPAVAFSDFQDDRRVITTQRWKFVLRGNLTSTMFDLERDPKELQAVASTAHPIAWRYGRIMLSEFLGADDRGAWWQADQQKRAELQKTDVQMDETLRGQLQALGYAH